jgi:hypothetical protein
MLHSEIAGNFTDSGKLKGVVGEVVVRKTAGKRGVAGL